MRDAAKPQPQYGSCKDMLTVLDDETAHLYPFAGRLPLADMATADLRAELARGLSLTAEVLTRLGQVWAELERRGEDLSDLRHGLARTLPLIAAGRLSAEAVVAFAGRPAVLRALDGLPLPAQQRWAQGEPIEVIDPTQPDAVQQIPLDRLPAAALRLVFAEGELRSPAAQRLALRPRRRNPEGKERRFRPRYDPASGLLTIGRMNVAVSDILAALAGAAGPDRPPASDRPDDYLTVKTRLSREEHERFQALCRRHQLPDWEMIRKALRAFGLL